jgi:hypothetical protein
MSATPKLESLDSHQPAYGRSQKKSWDQRQADLQALVPASKGTMVDRDVWNRLSERERIETMTGRSLDNCINILDLPMELAVQSPTVMNGKVGVIRAVFQVLVESGKRRPLPHAQEMLGELIGQFEAEAKK